VDTQFFGISHLKAYPAAGARHDVDAYVLAFDVEGIPPAAYWYDDESQALHKVGPPPLRREWNMLTGQQDALQHAAFAVLTVSCTDRLAWKYRTPHAYRHVWQHAGHAVQVMLMVATAMGLSQRLTGALSDKEIRTDIGLAASEFPTFLTSFNRTEPRD
jgi:SagB-type dehydrogenase family enzyme